MKILALTGIRSEYDILYPLLIGLKKNNFDVRVVVSGAHLSDAHNNTWKKIQNDKFKIVDKIDTLLSTDRLNQRSKALGLLISSLSQTVERENPQFILVVGDREEAIAAALVGNYMKKIVIHIGGGDDAYGNSDDPVRFAISKLAHLHCCNSKYSYNNLINVGEEKFRIFKTGNPYFVNIDQTSKLPKKYILNNLNVDKTFRDYLVLLKHPMSSEIEKIPEQMDITLNAIEKFCLKNNIATICIAPNSDPGSLEIIKKINKFKNKKWFYYNETLPRKIFINLMRNTKLLIGNSSMGILEAPYYKIPVINIGNRQKGRINAGNVKFVKYNSIEILDALHYSFFDKKYKLRIASIKNPYGDKTSVKKIIKAIKSVDLKKQKWYIKKNNFHE